MKKYEIDVVLGVMRCPTGVTVDPTARLMNCKESRRQRLSLLEEVNLTVLLPDPVWPKTLLGMSRPTTESSSNDLQDQGIVFCNVG